MQQDTFVKERTALAVQPEQGEDTIDLLELFMGLLAAVLLGLVYKNLVKRLDV